MFVSFEGVEGAGKSTALRAVARALEARGRKVCATREPGGSALGRSLRSLLLGADAGLDPMAELHLFLADRAQHLAEVVRPALARGETVLCDRYSDSTLAYQGYARGLDLELLRSLDAAASGGLRPDLTLLLDLPVELGLARVARRRGSGPDAEGRFDAEAEAFHRAVREGFLRIAELEPFRVFVVDAARSPEEVAASCVEAVDSFEGGAGPRS